MPAHEEQMSGGTAPGRALPRALLLAMMCATALVAESRPAAAFELEQPPHAGGADHDAGDGADRAVAVRAVGIGADGQCHLW